MQDFSFKFAWPIKSIASKPGEVDHTFYNKLLFDVADAINVRGAVNVVDVANVVNVIDIIDDDCNTGAFL